MPSEKLQILFKSGPAYEALLREQASPAAPTLAPISEPTPTAVDFAPTESAVGSEFRSELETQLSSATDISNQSFSDFISSDPYFSELKQSSDNLIAGLNEQIASLSSEFETPAVDVDALTRRLDQSFALTSNKILDATMVSAQKSALEMDAYLGSGRSDARSAVRSQMAGGIATQLVAQASRGIAQLYAGHAKSVVDTILAGAQINAQTKAALAGSIASLSDSASRALLGTSQALVGAYTASIDMGLELIKAKTTLLGTIYQAEASRYSADIQRYGYDIQAASSRYGADIQRYGYDIQAQTSAAQLAEQKRQVQSKEWQIIDRRNYRQWVMTPHKVGSKYRSSNPFLLS